MQKRTVSCEQELEIIARRDIDIIELDAVNLDIKNVYDKVTQEKLDYRLDRKEERLVISIGRTIKETEMITLMISLVSQPKKGFYFITPDRHYPKKRFEAWTQGQSIEARHWHPCLDHPQAKFPTEIFVTVPKGFVVISNGKLVAKERRADEKETYHWSEGIPHTAYLTSIVIGKYAEISAGEFLYYVPEDRKDDAERTFGRTPEIKKFLEEYLDTPYPYVKYSQVTVQNFVASGMENVNCTTLNIDTLHDAKAHLDFTSDKLVVHELAHQWFGNLITCRDWQHIWLNEGFATYSEALYWQKVHGEDEFHYFLLQIADKYLNEAVHSYTRPIVTNVYKHPDDLFDAHSYEKGAWVVHMLRCYLGDNYFRRSIKKYLHKFYNGNAETDDLRKILEEETGKSLQEFFAQWIYRQGHPELEVEFLGIGNTVRIKITQKQKGEPFKFPLDVKFMFEDGSERTYNLNISDKDNIFRIPAKSRIHWFSIDPGLKILKTTVIKAPRALLVNQLKKGKTVTERVAAARALAQLQSSVVIEALEMTILEDKFWGVAVEAAKSLGTMRSDRTFNALKRCLSKVQEPRTRLAVVGALGGFRKEEIITLLMPILQNDSSYFVQSQAAVAIGKTRKKKAIPILTGAMDTKSFQDVVGQGAITGLQEFPHNKRVVRLLLKKSLYGNQNKIREAATLALGKFVDDNPRVLNQLIDLLKDDWFRVRANACRALAIAKSRKAISYLISVADNDIDAGVRRAAEEAAIEIRESLKPKVLAARRIARVEYAATEPFMVMDWADRHEA